jgi:glycosyltransferase involved in cell wall biosynthesis
MPHELSSVVLLGPANDVHTQRWTEALAERRLWVTLATQHPATDWKAPAGVSVRVLPARGRLGYFANALALRRLVHGVRPDVVNAHYASGYGTTAAIVGYRPTVLSVWGSDVYDFPYQGPVAARLIRWNIGRATRVASTSEAMAAQVRRLLPSVGDIAITPFGVDTSTFRPRADRRDTAFITIGTVRRLADKYGIDLLIRAVARLRADAGLAADGVSERLRLLIVGDGPDRASLEGLAAEVGIRDCTRFVGHASHHDVPDWLNRMDVFVASSRHDSESFGVAVIEASSCEVPVVVSDVGGLPEVVNHMTTGLVVPREDEAAIATALKALVQDPALRSRMGAAGRARVEERYEWRRCVDTMLDCYRSVFVDEGAA